MIRYALPLTHLTASIAALWTAWALSQTSYMHTSVMFVAPLVALMGVHLLHILSAEGFAPGCASRLYRRTAQTAGIQALLLIVFGLTAPLPAGADAGSVMAIVLMVVVCAVITAVIFALFALAIYVFGLVFDGIRDRIFGPRDGDPDSRLFDLGSLVATASLLGVLALEDLPQTYRFDHAGTARSERGIAASPSELWTALDTATSPGFALPAILQILPQPVAVTVDEGTYLGAHRQVAFRGREGAGHLDLTVTERTPSEAVFTVTSDTTPYAAWIGYRTLTYTVTPDQQGSRLSVTLTYERRLAPAWIFAPLMKEAARLAADVLARDVKARAEL